MRGAAAAGGLTGLIVAGLGSRVVMRVIALMNDDQRGANTDASATVGDISVNGTLGLFMLGTAFGVLGGLMYLLLRRWLWVPRAWRGGVFGVGALVTVGQPVLDPANVDFQMFEPIVLVIAMFASLFLINGLILAPLADRIHPEPVYAAGRRVPRAAAALLALVSLSGAALMGDTFLTMVNDAGTCSSAVGGGRGCAVRPSDIAP